MTPASRPFTLPVPIWDTEVHVLFKKRGLKARLLALNLEDDDINAAMQDDYEGIAMLSRDQEAVIVLKPQEQFAELIGVFAHEAFHAAHMILDARGVLLRNKDNNEPHAYLVGYLVNKGAERMIQKRKKRA